MHEASQRALEGRCSSLKKPFKGPRRRRGSCWEERKRIVFTQWGVIDLPSRQIDDFVQKGNRKNWVSDQTWQACLVPDPARLFLRPFGSGPPAELCFKVLWVERAETWSNIRPQISHLANAFPSVVLILSQWCSCMCFSLFLWSSTQGWWLTQ